MINQPLFKLNIGQFSFAPKLFPTLITLLILPLLIYLGFWQLHRAEYKQTLLEQYQQRAAAKPLSLTFITNTNDLQQVQYYPIIIRGKYDNQHNLLLDNKSYQKQIGYQVLTPFFPENSLQAILINRGWIPRNSDRQILPIIPPIVGIQTIKGIIFLPNKKPFLLSKQIATNNWPRIIQTIAIPEITKWIGQSFYSWTILLSPENPYGFVREWHPITISPYKNYGYAVQWFGLALTLVIIFIGVNFRRR